MTGTAPLLFLPIALPPLMAFLLPIAERVGPGVARILARLTVLAVLAVAVDIALAAQTAPQILAVGGFAAPLGIVLYADRLSAVLLVALAAGLLLFWPKSESAGGRADILALLLLCGGAGLALTGDIFTMFVFYEITAVASYGLAASGGGRAGYGAALRFLILGSVGSTFALLGIALVYGAAGSLNLADLARLAPAHLHGPLGLAAFTLIVIGLGMKAELFPGNTWVPEVYAAAPARVTALFAGIVSKLAAVILLRLLVLLFHGSGASILLLVLGIAGVAMGELAAFAGRDFKRVFAYSSIAQLGLVAVAFSIPGPAGLAAGIAVAFHHMIVKPGLLTLAGRWTGPAESRAGAARKSPLAGALFVLFCLSLVGVPPLPGFWAKFLTIGAALAQPGTGHTVAVVVILAATVIEAAYLFRWVAVLYRNAEPAAPAAFAPGEIFPALVLGVVLLAVTATVVPLGRRVNAMAVQTANVGAYIGRVLIPGGGR